MTSPALTVRPITAAEHLAFLRTRRSASFLQTPAWGTVKGEWRPESLGWFDGNALAGVGLALHRRLPRVRRSLAYLPEGPVIDWQSTDLGAWLAPMTAHLRSQGAFGVRIGPPVVVNRWDAASVKAGVADETIDRLGEVSPTERCRDGALVVSQLRELGWQPQGTAGGFAAGQPRYNFQVPLRHRDGERAGQPLGEDEVLAAMNQQWRRNIKKATKEGVEVTVLPGAGGGTVPDPDLAAFHELYRHTAERDHFTPRPLGYFRTMLDALGAEEPDRIRLFLARHDGDLVAATLWIRVGGHSWYSYGASSTDKREVRGSNAAQWAMLRTSLAAGADVYDLRGITDTLDPGDAHVGLVQFKVGTGGEAVEYAGEWDLPLNRPLYAAFRLYLARRAGGRASR